MPGIQVNTIGGPAALARHLPRANVDAGRDMAVKWHRDIIPGKFERSAHSRYGYEPRHPRYIRYKLKLSGQATDLVFRGRMRAEVLAGVRVATSAGQIKATVSAPRYLYQYRKDYKQPDKAAELKSLHPDDEKLLAETYEKSVVDALQRIQEQETFT